MEWNAAMTKERSHCSTYRTYKPHGVHALWFWWCGIWQNHLMVLEVTTVATSGGSLSVRDSTSVPAACCPWGSGTYMCMSINLPTETSALYCVGYSSIKSVAQQPLGFMKTHLSLFTSIPSIKSLGCQPQRCSITSEVSRLQRSCFYCC